MPRKKKTEPKAYESPILKTLRANLTEETGDGKQDGKIWLSRIAKTVRLREQMPNGSDDWKRYYEWFEGEHWNDRGVDGKNLATDNARDTATVNAVGSIAGSYVPFLINGDILFKLIPRKQVDTVSAEIQQGLLNYEWGERGMTDECKRIVLDAVVIGHGIGKTGYVVEVNEARKESDGEIEYRDFIKQDAAYIERVDPILFIFDLSAKDGTLKTARWCGECFFTPYDDVVANTKYSPAVIAKIFAGTYKINYRKGFCGISSKGLASTDGDLYNVPEDNLVALWEIWDKKYKKHYIYAEGVDEPLVEEEWPYDYLDGFPYVKLDYIRVPNKPYGMGVYRQAEDQQLQLNRIRTAQFRHIRSHARKFIGEKGMIEPEQVKDFTDLGDGALIMAGSINAIKAIEDAPMSQDFQIVEGRIQADIQQLTGADALLQGAALPSRTTAGEVAARTNITRLKADDRVSAVVLMVKGLAVQVLQHLKANRTLPSVVRIVGAQGVYWQEFTNEEIQAETDLTVEYFSAPRFDPAVDREQKLRFFQVAVQAMPALEKTGETLDMPALVGWVLKSFDYMDAGRFFKRLLKPDAPLVEDESGEPSGNQGALAPTQIPEAPDAGENPAAGLTEADIAQGIRGLGMGG